jgi:hypothetical protein
MPAAAMIPWLPWTTNGAVTATARLNRNRNHMTGLALSHDFSGFLRMT